MSLIVEDATGLSTAESYLSVANADTYHASYTGSTAWSGASTGTKERALRRATQYLDSVYGGRWLGERYTETQALDWPRSDVEIDGVLLDESPLPVALRNATAELALREITETGGLLPDDTTGVIQAESTTVDVISTSVTYQGGKSPQTKYAFVERMLARILTPGNRAVRA